VIKKFLKLLAERKEEAKNNERKWEENAKSEKRKWEKDKQRKIEDRRKRKPVPKTSVGKLISTLKENSEYHKRLDRYIAETEYYEEIGEDHDSYLNSIGDRLDEIFELRLHRTAKKLNEKYEKRVNKQQRKLRNTSRR